MELAPFLASHGRMFTGGHCESVGIGGFLLQGGQGWNSRRWGWGCENVLAVDVVTADGELVHADADENADLYWAARGAGPGFLRRRHALPPAHVPAHADVPRHADLPARRPRADARVAARRAADARRRRRAGDGRDAAAHRRGRAAAAHDARRRRREGGRPPACDPWTTSRPSRSSTSAGRPRSPRRTRRRRCRTRRATATAPTASGRTRRPPSSRRCCATTVRGAAHPALVLDLVRLGADRRAARHGVLARGATSTSPPTDLGGPGGGRAAARLGPRPSRAARRAGGGGRSTSATPTSPAAPTASWPPTISTACAPSAGRGTPTAVSSAISVSNGRPGRRPRSASAR